MVLGMGVGAELRSRFGTLPRDLGTFNRWLNVSRLRAAAGVTLAIVALEAMHPGTFRLGAVLATCATAVVGSVLGLRWQRLIRRPALLFAGQTAFDLAIVTVGLWLVTSGLPAILFRSLYVLIVTPVCLVTMPGGLATVAAASVAHLGLLVAERGMTADVVLSIEAALPPVLLCLVAQQCFFYGGHLEQKNRDLAALAARLEQHRHDLAAEARAQATLVEIARTLSTTLDADELLTRVTRTMSEYLEADWGATFLADPAAGTFRIVGATDPEIPLAELARVDFPLHGWAELARLEAEPIVVLVDARAARVPALFTGGRTLGTVLLAALHRGDALTGFVAVGYREAGGDVTAGARRLLGGIAEHAATVLQNARLLSELRLAAELKSEFVGAVSHELRSPLNVIIGYAEMLRDGELGAVTADQAGALDRTHRQAVTLLEMITALLDLNRLEAGRLPISRTPVDVGALLTELVEQLPAAWRVHDVALRVDLDPGTAPLLTDRGKLKTVLRNLVHNALKFTPAGEVVVSATAVAHGVAFTVRDTGVGIPEDALPYVFEMFRQVPGTGGGGVGLGLHIVRRFVDALGGRVEVTSAVGVGTTFVVTLESAEDPSAAFAA
jgi:signal transduction histidine kinase